MPATLTAGLSLTALAIIAALLAGASGPPYLDLGDLNGWIAVFAAATFAALFTVPFAANRVLTQSREDRAERWEPAMLVWGGLALLVLAAGVALIAGGGYSPSDSLADAIGLLLTLEAGLVVLTLAGWMLSS